MANVSQATVGAPEPIKWDTFKVAIAAGVGTIIEWYDFYVYGNASALIFAGNFFNNLPPTLASVVSFLSFSIGFVARPVGSFFFGHFGDRIGRKRMLVLTVTLMGGATFLIGCLPTLNTIGLWAPILLISLRVVQGFAVGGEVGGAIVMAVEFAPASRRGLWGAFPQLGVAGGLVVANLVFLGVNLTFGADEFKAWAWRIPFWLSLALVLVAVWIRYQIDESPIFQRAMQKEAADKKEHSVPIFLAFRYGWANMLRIIGCSFFAGSIGYITIVYNLRYGTQTLGFTANFIFTVTIIANALEVFTTGLSGHLADTMGRRKICLIFTGFGVFLCAIYFPVISGGSAVLFAIMVILVRTSIGFMYGPQGALYSELFDTRMRYTALGGAISLATVVGSQTPAIAAALTATDHFILYITLFLTGASSLAFISFLTMPETKGRDIEKNIVIT